jgi:uncharacterized protein YigE (DUF2233 family)
MTKNILICVLWLLPVWPIARAQESWTRIQPGLDLLRGRFEDRGQMISFALVKCDPRKNQVRIIDVFHELGKSNSFSAYSLRAVWHKTGADLVTNAGSTASYSLPAPAGLLQIRGRIVSPLNRQTQNAGILCINRGKVAIVPVAQTGGVPKCTDAVQRGPYLTRESVSALDASQRFRRTAAAVDSDGNLLILVTDEGISLAALASFLYTSKLNLRVSAALNLDGAASSGLIATIMKSTRGESKIVVGSTDGLIASSIAITNKNP